MNRRDFLLSSAALAALAPFARAQPASVKKRALKKGFMYGTFGGPNLEKLKIADRFTLLRAAGFDGVEVNSAMTQTEVLAARDQSGLAIPSVVVSTHWAKPLSDPNPATREIGLEGLKQGLRDAKAYGASSVLLVPAVVTKETSYADAYTRSVAEIAKAVPLAESLGVVIAIENVWNRFLLSPLEAVAYTDSFKSPMVRWHLDVGNIVNTGWPEHWIRTLGPRIVKIHVKEYSRKIRDEKGPGAGFKVDLFEGDSDWPKVLAALDAIGYSGWMITEQYRPPDLEDAAWLAQLSAKLDAVIAS